MHLRSHIVVLASILALIGFSAPLCAVACSTQTESPSVSRSVDLSAEASRGGCHGREGHGSGRPEGPGQHDCDTNCDSVVLMVTHQVEIERTTTKLVLLPVALHGSGERLVTAVENRPLRVEPRARVPILLQKSSLQI